MFNIFSAFLLDIISTALIDALAAVAGLENTSLKIGLFPIPILNFLFNFSGRY